MVNGRIFLKPKSTYAIIDRRFLIWFFLERYSLWVQVLPRVCLHFHLIPFLYYLFNYHFIYTLFISIYYSTIVLFLLMSFCFLHQLLYKISLFWKFRCCVSYLTLFWYFLSLYSFVTLFLIISSSCVVCCCLFGFFSLCCVTVCFNLCSCFVCSCNFFFLKSF